MLRYLWYLDRLLIVQGRWFFRLPILQCSGIKLFSPIQVGPVL